MIICRTRRAWIRCSCQHSAFWLWRDTLTIQEAEIVLFALKTSLYVDLKWIRTGCNRFLATSILAFNRCGLSVTHNIVIWNSLGWVCVAGRQRLLSRIYVRAKCNRLSAAEIYRTFDRSHWWTSWYSRAISVGINTLSSLSAIQIIIAGRAITWNVCWWTTFSQRVYTGRLIALDEAKGTGGKSRA